jgi:hypothetical protein
MRHTRMRHARRRQVAPVAVGLVATAMTVAGLGAATASGAAASTTPGPKISLIAPQKTVTVPRFGKQVFLDPGIWVAANKAPLRIDVARSSYTTPVRAVQIIKDHGVTIKRPLPSWVLDGWNGLRDFMRMTVRNVHGKVVASKLVTFCPDSYNAERAGPNSATTDPYPQGCGPGDPFPISEVWGLARGWAADPSSQFFGFGPGSGPVFKLGLGTYHVTESITPGYNQLFGIPARDRSATVTVHVVKQQKCCSPKGCCTSGDSQHRGPVSRPLPSLPKNVPLLSHVPANALPDLTPLPSWGISTSHVRKTKQDFVNFGATVWVGGHSPLDVEGFRTPGSATMKAYQYYWHDGRIVGRTPAGTMGFDNKKGHHHWHFEQFAKYVLLNASKKVAVRSEKVGFCIAPTDSVNMAMPGATWQPTSIGLGGECGVPTALWVQEYMPIGWGDTYDQFKAGQAFNITSLPDGTYYIEIIANPEHLLHEVTQANDVSLRKIIITGPAGHRHVRVPAWHGIDPEK